MLETFVGGARRRVAESVYALRRVRSGQMIAAFSLELYGCYTVHDMWLIRRNDDRLFLCGADYRDPRGPRAHHRYFRISDNYEAHLLSTIVPMIRSEIEANGCLDAADEFLLNELPHLQPIEPVALEDVYAEKSDHELVRAGKFALLPEPLHEVVGYVHFNLADVSSVWDCPIVLRRGAFYVASPFDIGSMIRPVRIDDPFRHELTAKTRAVLSERATRVPDYLQGAIASLRAGASSWNYSDAHDRLSFLKVA